MGKTFQLLIYNHLQPLTLHLRSIVDAVVDKMLTLFILIHHLSTMVALSSISGASMHRVILLCSSALSHLY